MRLTVGIDHKEAEVIGKQWMSWCLYEDMHYRFEVRADGERERERERERGRG